MPRSPSCTMSSRSREQLAAECKATTMLSFALSLTSFRCGPAALCGIRSSCTNNFFLIHRSHSISFDSLRIQRLCLLGHKLGAVFLFFIKHKHYPTGLAAATELPPASLAPANRFPLPSPFSLLGPPKLGGTGGSRLLARQLRAYDDEPPVVTISTRVVTRLSVAHHDAQSPRGVTCTGRRKGGE
jgi:hypothetical protein